VNTSLIARRTAPGSAREEPSGSSKSIDIHATEARTDGAPNIVLEVYRLVSVDSTSAPRGGVGDDWRLYRIARGANVVTGYRRGTRESVTVEVERIVEALNERLFVRPRRVHIQLGKAAPTKSRALARDEDLV
jgi:hypothetical protein